MNTAKKMVVGVVIMSAIALAAEAPVSLVKIDFEDQAAGKAPSGFVTANAGAGKEGEWVIQEDAGKKVLAQTGTDKTDNRFPVCVLENVKAKDVDVTVKFFTVSGEVDKAGGIVARYKDKGNYYVVRANAEEGNVRLYKFEDGKRSKPIGGKNLDVPHNQWHTLKLTLRGNQLAVFFNGEELFKAQDDKFADAGQVGLWTKADSVTRFDDLTIAVMDK